MTTLLITGIVLLLLAIVVLLSILNDKANALSENDPEATDRKYKRVATWLMVFNIVFLVACFWSAYDFKNYMLGYGPHTAASEHGPEIDSLFNITLFFTTLIFVLTTFALFWFSYKYRHRRGHRASNLAHNTKLEIIWTALPALVLTVLVVKGIVAWNNITADVDPSEQYLEIDVTGQQFLWNIRYPGKDGHLGAKDFRLIKPGVNELGQDWRDKRNLDDFMADEIVIPKGRKVKFRIYAKDVLHSFFLPHFRAKMDAVPGLPTYFVVTPTTTTEEYRQRLSNYPEYQVPSDPEDPNSPPLWKAFNYELACAELCGIGHYSMRRVVRVVEPEEFEAWYNKQKSYYFENIRFTEDDPYRNELLPFEVAERKADFINRFNNAYNSKDEAERIIQLRNVHFKTGSSELTALSRYELDFAAEAMQSHPEIQIEVAGHTDNVGNPESNKTLSEARANAVMKYLMKKGVAADRMEAKGYGQDKPVASNDNAEGRQKNRRTELIIK